jgi:predicted nucleotidyltransferase
VSALPAPVAELVEVLTAIPDVVAVVLGGSHAVASNDAESDCDLGVYYRRAIDLTKLAAVGDVHPPDRWDVS